MNISPKRRKEDDLIEDNEEPLLELTQPHHHHRGRKLKQYVVEEKLDIIDFAKVNGNRAAGREFSVRHGKVLRSLCTHRLTSKNFCLWFSNNFSFDVFKDFFFNLKDFSLASKLQRTFFSLVFE
jgi:hypothetical protein